MKLSSGYKSVSDVVNGVLGESDVGEVISYDGPVVVKALIGKRKYGTLFNQLSALECASTEFVASANAQGSGNK